MAPEVSLDGLAQIPIPVGAVKSTSTTLPLFAVPDGFEEEDLREVQQAQITIRMDFANFADYWEPTRRVPLLPGLLDGLPSEWHQRVCSAGAIEFGRGECSPCERTKRATPRSPASRVTKRLQSTRSVSSPSRLQPSAR